MRLIVWFLVQSDRLRRDKRGQDLIEYALLIGFAAFAAAAVLPDIADHIHFIFRKVRLALRCANGRARACEILHSLGEDDD